MKNFEELQDFIKKNLNKDWQEKLKNPPYNLQSVTQFPYNPNWWMLVYNLFESDLDNKVVKECRGTVVEVLEDGTVNVVCAPYVKFFDINDVHADKINWGSKQLKCESKIDGQLIKMFKYKGRDYWVTNGGTGLNTPINYETDDVHNYKDLMAKALIRGDMDGANKILPRATVEFSGEDFNCNLPWVEKIPDGWTLMFELTSPQNKIICKYDEVKLWFHGCRDAEGAEHTPEEAAKMFGIPYEIPKRWDLNNREDILAALEKFNGEEQEGFVVVDEETWTRVKMKSPSYLALKYIRDHDTPEGIWRLCVLENHDDYPELKEKTDKQVAEINMFNREFVSTMEYAKKVYENDKCCNRKDFALWTQEHVAEPLRPLYFAAIDKEPHEYLKGFWDKWKDSKTGYDKYLQIVKKLAK